VQSQVAGKRSNAHADIVMAGCSVHMPI
jgi:hypothetical protein